MNFLKTSAISLVLVAYACGGEGDKKDLHQVLDSSYTYVFFDEEATSAPGTKLQGNCSTGVHQFDKIEDYCKAILDDAENNQCASGKRQAAATSMNCGQYVMKSAAPPPVQTTREVAPSEGLNP